MPKLASESLLTAYEFTVDDQPAAYACADGYQHSGVPSASGAETVLCPGRGVRIVLDIYRSAEAHAQEVGERQPGPVEVGGRPDCTGDRVNTARDAHADSIDGVHCSVLGDDF